ncbi:MAG: intradiol ring-cleavage dioxygenase [Candidatus Methylomirabilia bacterium]
MRDFTEYNLTDAVLQQVDRTPDKRFKQIMTSLITHLHAFVREVELSEAEWFEGTKFLTATGHMCDDLRQEFILLSDTLGVSMLVDAISHRKASGATESTILGPFYRAGATELRFGDSIARDTKGEPTFFSGRVTDPDGKPIARALLDIWQAAPNGRYDNQDPDQVEFSLRGKFRTDAEGRYAFRTVKPASYPIPTDGPVGSMLAALGRHPWRPAHVHFIVSAQGYEPLTTHLFVKGDPYLESDAVFAVKSSLAVNFVRHDSSEEAAQRQVTPPFYTAEYDFGLKPAARPATLLRRFRLA